MTKEDYNARVKRDKWLEAKRERIKFVPREEIESFAASYVQKYEKYPPDFFKPSHSYVWREVRKATAPNGFITKLSSFYKGDLHFVTLLPNKLSYLSEFYKSPNSFFSPYMLEEVRRILKRSSLGPLYYRVELGESDVMHVHLIGGKRALRCGGFKVEVYNEEGLVRYLKKPLLPWNAKNFARYLLAKKIYGRLSPHSGVLGMN
jgi:hypothetical protein